VTFVALIGADGALVYRDRSTYGPESGFQVRQAKMTAKSNGRAAVRTAKAPARDLDRPMTDGGHFPAERETSLNSTCATKDLTTRLSVRAQNVLKELAVELNDEYPPRTGWVPSDGLLQKLTFRRLATARNCGPQTTAEIVQWAQARGKIIKPAFSGKKSLSAMWQDVVEKFSTGEISKAAVAEALESSARRKNTRIPVAFQKVLLQLVSPSNE
jgi:hypothetical protein